MQKVRLLADRVLVEILPVDEQKTAGGLIIPSTNTEEAPTIGKVIAVSSRIEKCEVEEDKVYVEDTIIFSKYAGSDITIKGVSYKVIRITDIFLTLEKEVEA